MTKVTWKGEPGGPNAIEQFGHTFPAGECVDVPANHKQLHKLRRNPRFEVEGDASDDVGSYDPVHKGRGMWAVKGPEGSITPATFTKEQAVAYAAEQNAKPVPVPDASEPVE